MKERRALAVAGEAVCRTMALYMTVNFSHGKDGLLVPVKEHLHRDTGDQSTTILILWQDKDTPEEHAIHWYCDGELTAVKGVYACLFNGRRHAHGVIPPAIFSSSHPWYGSALVRKYVH